MNFKLSASFRKSFRRNKLQNIEENLIPESQINSIQDETIKRRCRQSLQIKEGANRIFSLSYNLYQQLDAAKAVLVSTRRIEHITSKINMNRPKNAFTRGQITISDLKIPLLWRSINGTLIANGNYVVFCLILVDNEAKETQLLGDINSTIDDVLFTDVIQINDVFYESKCYIEIYGYPIHTSSSHLIRRSSSRRSSFDLTNGILEEGSKKKIFDFLGRVEIYAFEPTNSEMSYNIVNINRATRCDLPMFGTLSCQFRVSPMTKIKCIMSGEISIKFLETNDLKSIDWSLYYCEMKDRALHCWKSSPEILRLSKQYRDKKLVDREDVESEDIIIPITKFSKVFKEQQFKNITRISTYFDKDCQDHQEVLIQSEEDWFFYISKHIKEQNDWSGLFDNEDLIPAPTSFLRQGSVYRISNL